MNSYRLGGINPPLDELELFLLDVVGQLWIAQGKHQFPSAKEPRLPRLADFVKAGQEGVDEQRAATSKWRDALRQHFEEHGHPKPEPRASLDHLWERMQKSHSIMPTRREGDDLFFETFGISQRFIDEPPSPTRRWARWYFVGYPTSSHSFRCVANEASNRKFITANPLSRCNPPGAQDFLPISVSTIATDRATKEKRSTVMQLHLPSQYGAWRIVKTDTNQNEEIVG